jgi:hypothetical protein
MSLTATLDASNLSAKIAAAKLGAQSGLKSGVQAAAALFENEAKDIVPVRTGELRDAIHTETIADTPDVQTLQVTPVEDAANKYGFEPPYARRIEFGFVGTDSLGRHYHQAPEPYMRPAFDNQQDAAEEAITSAVLAGISAAGNG